MLQNDLKRRKAVCPNCGATNSQAQISLDAECHGIWVKCKICKKEFEIIIKSAKVPKIGGDMIGE